MAPVTKPKVALGPTYFRAWRDFRDIGQQEAADAASISRALLSKIENSRSPYLQQHVAVALLRDALTSLGYVELLMDEDMETEGLA